MNPDTGHLASQEDLLRKYGSERAMRDAGYEPVPSGALSNRARKLLRRSGGSVTVPQSDHLTQAMRRVRAKRKKADKQARKRGRR